MLDFLKTRKTIQLIFIVVLALSSVAAACNKKQMVTVVSDAITSLKAGLEIAESAHRNGLMEQPAYRGTLETGSIANAILGEVNEFAAQFPEDGAKPTEDQKNFVLGRIEDALQRFDKLIENGVLIEDPDGRRNYLTKIRQAKALAKGLADAIRKIEAVKPKPPGGQSAAVMPNLLRA